MPLYYFEPEGPGWLDYEDEDGIELSGDAKALAYAYTIIHQLTADLEDSDRPSYLLVKNVARKIIFRISLEKPWPS